MANLIDAIITGRLSRAVMQVSNRILKAIIRSIYRRCKPRCYFRVHCCACKTFDAIIRVTVRSPCMGNSRCCNDRVQMYQVVFSKPRLLVSCSYAVMRNLDALFRMCMLSQATFTADAIAWRPPCCYAGNQQKLVSLSVATRARETSTKIIILRFPTL